MKGLNEVDFNVLPVASEGGLARTKRADKTGEIKRSSVVDFSEWRRELGRCFVVLSLEVPDELLPPITLAHDIAALCKDVPEFANAQLSGIGDFSLYRTLLYAVVRALKPAIIVETGILNGFGSSFLLQGLEDNMRGRLISIDLPHTEGEYKDQGTMLLPKGKEPGWAIPVRLRRRHTMLFGRSEILLPRVLESDLPDLFVHDSDHRYAHMMMEISLVWSQMKQGLLLCDNVEQNAAFADFAAGAAAQHVVVASYNSPTRLWQHGIMRK